MEAFLQVVSDIEALAVATLALFARVEVGIGSFEDPSGPEKEAFPPLATEGVDLEKR